VVPAAGSVAVAVVVVARQDHGKDIVMKTASALFSSDDKQSIAVVIAKAEKLTAAEIVPVVATVSGRYDRAEDIFGVLTAIVALCAAWIVFKDPGSSDWSWLPASTINLPTAVGVIIGGFIVGAGLATHFPSLRLPFISRAEMLEEVERRALETFQRQRVRDTAQGTGVLIYVSLYEHLIKVIGDDAVNEKLGQAALDEICSLVVAGLKDDQPADGLKRAITRAGEFLAKELPASADDTNELANQLILID
jgi:putative membrane protein